MGLEITVEPAAEPISTAEAKAHVRYELTDEDTLIDSLIVAARKQVEMFTRRQLVTATYSWTLDEFPNSSGTLYVPAPPLISIGSFSYVDTDGATQTLAESTGYLLDTKSEPGRLTPAYETTWPGTRTIMNAVTIVFDAGYGDATTVPDTLKQAMLLLIGHWFENREAVTLERRLSEVPLAVSSLLWGERVLVA